MDIGSMVMKVMSAGVMAGVNTVMVTHVYLVLKIGNAAMLKLQKIVITIKDMMYVKHVGKTLTITVKHVGIGMKDIGAKMKMIAGEKFVGIIMMVQWDVMNVFHKMIA